MKNINRYIINSLLVATSFFLGFISAQYVLNIYYSSKFKVFYWDSDPILVVCPSSRYTEDAVDDALYFWEKKGHSVSFVHVDRDNSVCKKGKLRGFIFLRGDEGAVTSNSYAITIRHAERFQLYHAEMQIPNENLHMPLLLEHELGHAFGFTHCNEKGHIMHQTYSRMGSDFYYPD